VSVDQLTKTICGSVTPEPSGNDRGSTAAYRCQPTPGGGSTFLYRFASTGAEQVKLAARTCQYGDVIAGPGWIATPVYSPQVAGELVDLGGTLICG
jgi:hypothetical protein